MPTITIPGIQRLQDATDVSIVGLADGDVLRWNAATSKFEPDAPFSGVYSDLSGKPTLGTAAALDVGTSSGNIPQLGSGGLPAVGGGNLTGLNATNISTGTLNAARLPTSATTQGNTFNGNSQLVQLDSSGKLPAIDGSQLTNLPGGGGDVTSVAGRTGDVVLSTSDISGLATVASSGSYSDLSGTPDLSAYATIAYVNSWPLVGLGGPWQYIAGSTSGSGKMSLTDSIGAPTGSFSATKHIQLNEASLDSLDYSPVLSRLKAGDTVKIWIDPSNWAIFTLDNDVSFYGPFNSWFCDVTYLLGVGSIAAPQNAWFEIVFPPVLSLATVATTGAYSDLTGTPSFATVATSGDYGDLTGTPSLGTIAALNVGTTEDVGVMLSDGLSTSILHFVNGIYQGRT